MNPVPKESAANAIGTTKSRPSCAQPCEGYQAGECDRGQERRYPVHEGDPHRIGPHHECLVVLVAVEVADIDVEDLRRRGETDIRKNFTMFFCEMPRENSRVKKMVRPP